MAWFLQNVNLLGIWNLKYLTTDFKNSLNTTLNAYPFVNISFAASFAFFLFFARKLNSLNNNALIQYKLDNILKIIATIYYEEYEAICQLFTSKIYLFIYCCSLDLNVSYFFEIIQQYI